MWLYPGECSPATGNPRIVLQPEAFGLSWPSYRLQRGAIAVG
jgi:hypothetical protein